jgi:hypothetical protein
MTNPAATARANAQSKWSGATVAERGRKFIRHQHPTEPDRFMLDTAIGPMHYGAQEDQEIDTAWISSSGAWDWEVTANDFHCFVRDSVPVSYRYEDVATGHFVELTVNAIEWVNDEGDSESAAAFSQVTPAIDDNQLTWSNIATGWDVTVLSGLARLSKLLSIDTLTNLGSPTIGGTNPALSFDFQFQKSAGLDVYVDGVLWDEKANNPQATATDIEFIDNASSNPVFWFKKPSAEDNDSSFATTTMTMRKAGNNLFSSVRVPWSWLQSASFPVEIDPTIDSQVGASADDGGWGTATGYQNADATTNLGSSTSQNRMWARWTGITITDGSTIDDAYVECYFRDAETGSEETITVYFEDAAAPTAPTDRTDAESRATTTASYNWTVVGNTGNAFFSTGTNSLDSIIQELEDSYDYSSGAAMQAILHGTGGTVRIRTEDHLSGQNAPKLHIEYTGTADPAPNVSDNIDVSDTITVSVSAPTLAVSDDLAITDSVTVTIGVTTDPAPNVSDNIDVSDIITVVVNAPTLAVSDDLAITDSVTVTITDNITYLVDTFTDSDSTALTSHTPDTNPAANNWTAVASNSFTINGNVAEAADVSNNVLKQNVIDLEQSDVSIVARMRTRNQSDATYWTGLIFRYLNSSNYWRLELTINPNIGSVGFWVWKIVSGAETGVADLEGLPFATAINTWYDVRLHMSGNAFRLTFGTDDTTAYPAIYWQDSFNNTATSFGVSGHSRSGGHAAIDDLTITSPITITYDSDSTLIAKFVADAVNLRDNTNAVPADGDDVVYGIDLTNRGSMPVPKIYTSSRSGVTYPRYQANGWAAQGKDVLQFDNASDYNIVKGHAPFDRTDAVTFYAYFKLTAAAAGGSHDDPTGLRMVGGAASDGDLRFFFYTGTPDTNLHILYRKGDGEAGNSTDIDTGISGAQTDPTLIAVSVDWAGTTCITRANGSTLDTDTGIGLWNNISTATLIWGMGGEADGDYQCTTEIRELRLYNVAHSVAEMQVIEAEILDVDERQINISPSGNYIQIV